MSIQAVFAPSIANSSSILPNTTIMPIKWALCFFLIYVHILKAKKFAGKPRKGNNSSRISSDRLNFRVDALINS